MQDDDFAGVRADFKKTLETSLIVRYLLVSDRAYESEMMTVCVLGVPHAKVLGMSHLVKADMLIHVNDTLGAGDVSVGYTAGEKSTDEELTLRLKNWWDRTEGGPWWRPWLEPKPFVGVQVSAKNTHVHVNSLRELDRDNLQLPFYHGIVALQLARHAKQLEYAANTEPSLIRKRDAFSHVAKQFSALAAQSRHATMRATIGT